VRENMTLWQSTVEAFHRQVEADTRDPVLIGKVGRDFAYNREEVYSRIRVETERRLNSYDVGIESRRIIEGAMRGVFHSFGLGVGALGLGYLFTSVVTSMALDVTGLTAATMLLVTSFLILPYKRSKAKVAFTERIEELRKQMVDALTRESAIEIDRMVRGIQGAFEPYETFYATESERIERFAERLRAVETGARDISSSVASL
jgi:hypothetical protein